MTPNDMPKRKPQHTWTPPQRHARRVVEVPAPAQQGNDNSARRRARRNGWTESRQS